MGRYQLLPLWANCGDDDEGKRLVIRRTPVRRAARRRVANGGPRARSRSAATVAEWTAIKAYVRVRAGWRCQACGMARRLDVHHVVKRAQGGSDFDVNQLVALCRSCHERTDWPYAKGRLVITPLGAREFRFEIMRRAGKWATPGPLDSLADRRGRIGGGARIP